MSLSNGRLAFFISLLVDKHEAIQILGLILSAQRLDGEAVVPCGLIDVDSTCLHGRPGAGSEIAGLTLRLGALRAQAAWAGKKRKSLVITVLEHLAFKLYDGIEVSSPSLSPVYTLFL
jgi:hypothetical protein